VLVSSVPAAALEAELARLEPAELLLPATWGERPVPGEVRATRTVRPAWLFEPEFGAEEVRRRYAVQSLDGFGFQADEGPLIGALGALLAYLAEVQPGCLATLRPPRIERGGGGMVLDEMTRRNLELVEPLRGDAPRDGRPATLIEVIDETLTPMGARRLRRWLLRPLIGAERIWERQEAVAELLEHAGVRRSLRAELKRVRDLERLAGKVGAGRVLPRELRALATSLSTLPVLRALLAESTSPLLRSLHEGLDELVDVRALLDRALADDPPATLADGGVVRAGWSGELDELRALHDGAQDTIARLQSRERERSGISSLRVGYNKVFGYYLEVTRSQLQRVPADYERKQTLANAERYVTPELKEWESKVLDAEDRIAALEPGCTTSCGSRWRPSCLACSTRPTQWRSWT
jgi:DNA mismatch repair protein MutS